MSRKYLKLYIHTKYDLDEQIEVYKNIFSAEEYKRLWYTPEMIKANKLDSSYLKKSAFAVLKFYGDIMILMSRWSPIFNQNYGANSSFVINFDDDKNSFNRTYEQMVESDNFVMQYDKNTWNSWGTQIVKFHDKFGYSWVLELDVRKVDNEWNPVKGQIKNHKSLKRSDEK